MEENTQVQSPEPEPEKKKEKKNRSPIILWILLILVIWWFNNFTLKGNNVKKAAPKLAQPLRIAVISDWHVTKLGIKGSAIFGSIDKAKPDIVFFLGDMYTTGSKPELMQKPVDLAADLMNAGYPVYAVTGEHDADAEYISGLEKIGVHVMNYKEENVVIKGSRLHIMGIDNAYYSPTFDLKNAFSISPDSYNILLAHIPYYEKFADFGADLTLCGDSHGEMAQIPFGGGPIYCSETSTWLPKLFSKETEIYDKGFFDYEGGTMFVTSGIGVYPVPVRFNNRPEVAIIDLEKGE